MHNRLYGQFDSVGNQQQKVRKWFDRGINPHTWVKKLRMDIRSDLFTCHLSRNAYPELTRTIDAWGVISDKEHIKKYEYTIRFLQRKFRMVNSENHKLLTRESRSNLLIEEKRAELMQLENGLFTAVFPPGFTGDPVRNDNFWRAILVEKAVLTEEGKNLEREGNFQKKAFSE